MLQHESGIPAGENGKEILFNHFFKTLNLKSLQRSCMKTYSTTVWSKSILNLKVQHVAFICSVNLIAYFTEVHLHHADNIWLEFIFKTLNVLILITWFIRISPAPFSSRNLLLMVSLLVSNTYPYGSGFFDNKDMETKMAMLLPMTSYLFLILAFGLHQEKMSKENKLSFFFKFMLPFIMVPILYFYMVLYQSLEQSSYLSMVIVYLLVLLTMLYYGININFSNAGRKLVFYSMALITLANELNAYNFFVEQFDWMFEIIRFLTIFSRVFLFCGFASEDISRSKDVMYPANPY